MKGPIVDQPYQPTLGQLWKLNVGATIQELNVSKSLRERLNALLVEYPPGRVCEHCGGMLIHYRLLGYRCFKGCQP